MGLILLVKIMVNIEITEEEFYVLKIIFDRIDKQNRRVPRKRKWIKQDGFMINLETGSMLDTSSNKFVIDRLPDLRALSGSDVNPIALDLSTNLTHCVPSVIQ